MSKNVTSILNDLIETSKDGEEGFRAAAADSKNAELQAMFLSRAGDCASGKAELQRLVTARGDEPEDSGSVAGAVHRGWVGLKAAVSSRTDLAILEECERGEDVAKASYSKALEDTLPEDIRKVVQRQYEGVLMNHNQIRDLRDRYRLTQ